MNFFKTVWNLAKRIVISAITIVGVLETSSWLSEKIENIKSNGGLKAAIKRKVSSW